MDIEMYCLVRHPLSTSVAIIISRLHAVAQPICRLSWSWPSLATFSGAASDTLFFYTDNKNLTG